MEVDKRAFEYAVTKIDDGTVFERFGLEFLAAVLDYSFIPVAGTKDKGVDGYQHMFTRDSNTKIIFQLTTELDYQGKINATIEKLKNNEISYSKLTYVTNRKVNNADTFADEVFDKTGIHLSIFDIRWLTNNSNNSEKTIRAYQTFVDTYLHEYSQPGKYHTVANLSEDSRLYVFLGQQFTDRADLKIDELLADTLILYSLEGTDPDKDIFRTEKFIREHIDKFLKFDPELLAEKIGERLETLSKKPRKIKFHSGAGGYCLPYETRVEIEQRNLRDEVLFNDFYRQTQDTVKKYFVDIELRVKDIDGLITRVFNQIFYKQGLEFSNFVLHGDSHSVVEQNLDDVIASAVDGSSVIITNKEKVKTALHLAIRDIVYNGTEEQRRFLTCLSNTYLMMFLLQWEPKLTTYFQSLASQLKVFVDNSIIIPALSEFYLNDGNKRHWRLLTGAKKAGISMFINETLLDELVSHFKMISTKYHSLFHEQEEFYLSDAYELLFIDEILIRAYFYGKRNGRVRTFGEFIDNFVDPGLVNTKSELITFLQETFGIKYISNEAWDIQVDQHDLNQLADELLKSKVNKQKAKADAQMILSIYYLRRKNNEDSEQGIFGYKTWWLSKDTATYKAVHKTFGTERFPVSCYIRPDFVYNYIALKPNLNDVKEAYSDIFPTMLGVNLSYHMPREVSQAVQEKLKQYHDKSPVRIKQILKLLSDKLKVDPNLKNRKSVELFLDKELRKAESVKKA
jgi:hypothetical protein